LVSKAGARIELQRAFVSNVEAVCGIVKQQEIAL